MKGLDDNISEWSYIIEKNMNNLAKWKQKGNGVENRNSTVF